MCGLHSTHGILLPTRKVKLIWHQFWICINIIIKMGLREIGELDAIGSGRSAADFYGIAHRMPHAKKEDG
jgi:hypothetical protein